MQRAYVASIQSNPGLFLVFLFFVGRYWVTLVVSPPAGCRPSHFSQVLCPCLDQGDHGPPKAPAARRTTTNLNHLGKWLAHVRVSRLPAGYSFPPQVVSPRFFVLFRPPIFLPSFFFVFFVFSLSVPFFFTAAAAAAAAVAAVGGGGAPSFFFFRGCFCWCWCLFSLLVRPFYFTKQVPVRRDIWTTSGLHLDKNWKKERKKRLGSILWFRRFPSLNSLSLSVSFSFKFQAKNRR